MHKGGGGMWCLLQHGDHKLKATWASKARRVGFKEKQMPSMQGLGQLASPLDDSEAEFESLCTAWISGFLWHKISLPFCVCVCMCIYVWVTYAFVFSVLYWQHGDYTHKIFFIKWQNFWMYFFLYFRVQDLLFGVYLLPRLGMWGLL